MRNDDSNAQIRKNIGANIRHLREEQGMTQLVLANMMGINRPYFGRIEQGIENPSVKITEALDVPLSHIFEDTDDRFPHAHRMDEECLKLLGSKIKEHRKKQKLSQDRLALMIGSSAGKAYISRIERGEANVSVAVLHRIAGALGVKVRDLIDF